MEGVGEETSTYYSEKETSLPGNWTGRLTQFPSEGKGDEERRERRLYNTTHTRPFTTAAKKRHSSFDKLYTAAEAV